MAFDNAPDQMPAEQREPFQALINAVNGGPSSWLNVTGINDASHYALDVLNGTAGTGGARFRGASGAAVRVKDSTVEIDGALTTQAINATTVTASGNVTSTGGNIAATAGSLSAGTSVTAGTTVQGTRLISTVAIGTAPLSVTSTTLVSNLNAQYLNGIPSSGFLTPAQGDARYLQLTGGTLTGQLVVSAAQALKLSGVGALGYFYLNVTNIANPVLELKDNAGNTMVSVNPAGSTYAQDVNLGTPATNAARFTGDVLITTDLGVRTVNATTNLNATANVTGAKIVAGGTGFSGSEKFRVQSGSSRLEGSVTVTSGGIDVTGSSIFQSGLSVAGGYSQTTGNFSLPNTNYGIYGATPVARQTISGSRGGAGIYVVVASLLSALSNTGTILDSTTP